MAQRFVRQLEVQNPSCRQPLTLPALTGEPPERGREGAETLRTPQLPQRVGPGLATCWAGAPMLHLLTSPAITIEKIVETKCSGQFVLCAFIRAFKLGEEQRPGNFSPCGYVIGYWAMIYA